MIKKLLYLGIYLAQAPGPVFGGCHQESLFPSLLSFSLCWLRTCFLDTGSASCTFRMWSSRAKTWIWPLDLHWSRWGASLNQPMEVIGQVYVMCHHGQGWGPWVRGSCFPKESGCFTLRANECWPGTHKGCRVTALLKCCLHSPLFLKRSWLFWFLLFFLGFYIITQISTRLYMIMAPFQYTVQWNLLQSIFRSIRTAWNANLLCQTLF